MTEQTKKTNNNGTKKAPAKRATTPKKVTPKAEVKEETIKKEPIQEVKKITSTDPTKMYHFFITGVDKDNVHIFHVETKAIESRKEDAAIICIKAMLNELRSDKKWLNSQLESILVQRAIDNETLYLNKSPETFNYLLKK